MEVVQHVCAVNSVHKEKKKIKRKGGKRRKAAAVGKGRVGLLLRYCFLPIKMWKKDVRRCVA